MIRNGSEADAAGIRRPGTTIGEDFMTRIPTGRIVALPGALWGGVALLLSIAPAAPLRGQSFDRRPPARSTEPVDPAEPDASDASTADRPADAADAESHAAETAPVPPQVLEKPTELGIRFTPAIARAIGKRMSEQMGPRYELTAAQTDAIADIFARRLMVLAQEGQEGTRDAIELLMASAVEHDGMLPPEQAVEFARHLQPVLPKLDRFFNDCAKQVAAQMPFRQRLKFTGDFAAVTAGFGLFKERMARWQRGEVDRMVNPFFDAPPASGPAGAADAASPQLDRARQRADRRLAMVREELSREMNRYVELAIEYYQLDDSQSASAQSILKDSQKRVGQMQNDDWQGRMRENRIRQYLCNELGPRYSGGPLSFQLEQDYQRLMRPVDDLTTEFKRRIDALPTSAQRAAAQRAADERYAEFGVKRG